MTVIPTTLRGPKLAQLVLDEWVEDNPEIEDLTFAESVAVLAGGKVKDDGSVWFQQEGYAVEPTGLHPFYKTVDTLLANLIRADLKDNVTRVIIRLIADLEYGDLPAIEDALNVLKHY